MASVTPRVNPADLKGFAASLDMSIETWQLDVYRAMNQGQKWSRRRGASVASVTPRGNKDGVVPLCGVTVFWWDGEYENQCELPRDHDGDHRDSLGSWYDDDMSDKNADHEDEDG